MQRQTDQATVAAVIDLRRDIDKSRRQQHPVLHHPHRAALLPNKHPPIVRKGNCGWCIQSTHDQIADKATGKSSGLRTPLRHK